ncbi:hypothetical protein GQ42DRAFT_160909 [Ramicandelaber brevisporus]|nr:hypothetical protein GQ42DRAFT_160909 [Ramicandelaber brevisporus]
MRPGGAGNSNSRGYARLGDGLEHEADDQGDHSTNTHPLQLGRGKHPALHRYSGADEAGGSSNGDGTTGIELETIDDVVAEFFDEDFDDEDPDDSLSGPLNAERARAAFASSAISIDDDNNDSRRLSDVLRDDPLLAKEIPSQSAGVLSSFFNLTNAIIGAGIIGLPYAFREAGFGMGIVLLITLGFVVDWTLRLLAVNAKLSGRRTYQEMVQFCFGSFGMYANSFFQFVMTFGGQCAYLVIIGDTIPQVLVSLFPGIPDHAVFWVLGNRRFIILVMTLFVVYPLTLYRDVGKLAKVSALALVSMVIIVLAVCIEAPRAPESQKGDPSQRFTFLGSAVFQAIGVITFAFVCHHNSFLIFGSLTKPTLQRVDQVVHSSTIISVAMSLVIAIAGYLVFTDKTQGNILNNFPSSNLLINIARVCFGLNMVATYPLETFVAREVVEHLLFANNPSTTGSSSMLRHVLVTTGLVATTLLVGLTTCDLGFVMELTGGLSATALAFVLPPACYIKMASGKLFSRGKAVHWLCLVFGFLVAVLSTVLSITNFMNSSSESSQQCFAPIKATKAAPQLNTTPSA